MHSSKRPTFWLQLQCFLSKKVLPKLWKFHFWWFFPTFQNFSKSCFGKWIVVKISNLIKKETLILPFSILIGTDLNLEHCVTICNILVIWKSYFWKKTDWDNCALFLAIHNNCWELFLKEGSTMLQFHVKLSSLKMPLLQKNSSNHTSSQQTYHHYRKPVITARKIRN